VLPPWCAFGSSAAAPPFERRSFLNILARNTKDRRAFHPLPTPAYLISSPSGILPFFFQADQLRKPRPNPQILLEVPPNRTALPADFIFHRLPFADLFRAPPTSLVLPRRPAPPLISSVFPRPASGVLLRSSSSILRSLHHRIHSHTILTA
jgi:hypothetical protein